MTKPFSLAFKQKMIARLTGKDAISARQLALETGLHQQTLSRWVTPPQLKRMFAIAKGSGWSTDQMKGHLRLKFGIDSSKDLPAGKYDQACADFETAPVAPADMPL